MKQEPVIREATLEDCRPMAAVHIAGWRAAYRGHMPDALLDGLDVGERAEKRRQHLESPPSPEHRTFVSLSAGEVVAFAVCGSCRGTPGSSIGEVYAIYVAPQRWGEGIGRGLLAHCTAYLERAGFTAAALWVLDANESSRRFYERAGWRADGGIKTEEFAGATLTEVRYTTPLPVAPAATSAELGVIFDMDGILIDSEQLFYRSYSAVLADYGVSVTKEVYAREWIAKGTGAEWAVATFGLDVDPAVIKADKQPIFMRLLEEEVELMPGASEAVARMAALCPIAVATNSPRSSVGMALDRFDLRRHFQSIVTRERYVGGKPLPDAFLTAAKALGQPPARCLVVEDSQKGVRAAAAAGAACVAIPHELTQSHDFSTAARVLGSLDELTVELVHELLAEHRER